MNADAFAMYTLDKKGNGKNIKGKGSYLLLTLVLISKI
jgi:hypothetical protein